MAAAEAMCQLGALPEVPGCRVLFDAMDEGVAVYRVLFDAARQPADVVCLYVNPSFRRWLGADAKCVLDRPAAELLRLTGDATVSAYLEAFATGKPQRIEGYSPALDRWFLISVTPMGGDQFATVLFDITGRKRMEMQLEQERSFNAALIESIPGILYVYDTRNRLIKWNKRHETETGFSAEELYLKDGHTWFDDEDRAAIEHSQENIRKLGYNVVRANLICKSGERRPYLLTAVRSSIGAGFSFLGIGIDISDLVQAERDRAELQRRLAQVQRLETIGRLAGGVAHDFNNLLTVIRGYADLLRAERNEPAAAMAVAEISKAADRAAELTAQLLTVSRRQIIRPRALDLNHSVRETEDMLRRLVGEDVEVATALDADLGRVYADPGQIHQVLMNLAANARDAMPGGGRLLIETANVRFDDDYVRSHPETVPGPAVLLAVTDSGTGMTDDVRQRIFEPFFTTKEKGRGTGLGLATVYGIVRQSGGWIWVYSEPGQGTTFKIYFPRIDAAPAPEEPAAEVPAVGGTETVLLVEDQEAVRKLVCQVLGSKGYRVLAAADGNEAVGVAEAQAGAIDLLLTDVILPGMNGQQVADRVRERHPGVRVLFASGYTENVIAHRGVLKPGVTYLPKPFSPEGAAGQGARGAQRRKVGAGCRDDGGLSSKRGTAWGAEENDSTPSTEVAWRSGMPVL